jgi:type IV pilus assembly protein PilB
MRILDAGQSMTTIDALGMGATDRTLFEKSLLGKTHGAILVTGPTGSGKTNTLYSALAALNQRDTNIMTAEDPVECNLHGVNQVQIREAVGLTFAAALRELLRQDPDVIMVGEIRDYETAEIAVKAALTGHLVLATLHTNDAPSTVSRLVNMGIEPFLLGTAVHLVQAQRLVRRICAGCKADVTKASHACSLIAAGFAAEELPELRLYRGLGCTACGGSGYKGRVGLYETLEMSERVRDLVMIGATPLEIRRAALEEGMLTLRMSGLEKIRRGITTLEEVLRETVS